MSKRLTFLTGLIIFIAIVIALGPFFVVEEGEQAVITRFGQIVNVETEAGLKIKIPIIDQVRTYSKKILSWDGEPRRVPTLEKQFIWVDTSARWRIVDVRRFYSSINLLEQAYSRLDDIIESTVRTVIAQNKLVEAVRNSNAILQRTANDIETFLPDTQSEDDQEGLVEISNLLTQLEEQPEIEIGREALSVEMFELIKTQVPNFGIEMIDVVIRQIRYSDDLTDSVYNRMISERKQIAQAYRSWGEGRKQKLLGQLENEQRAIQSVAYNESEQIKGEADAEAASIYATAYNRNTEFFSFYRALESYRKTIPNLPKVLSTEAEYFDYLYDKDGQ